MGFSLNRKRLLSALTIVLLLLSAFTLGFVSSGHLKTAVPNDLRKQYLQPAGDATLSVRSGVLAALRSFQDGYVKRDPKELDSFMSRLFLKDDDILLMGTDAGEWARGYTAVGEFIGTDWREWGDFRFAVDDSIVWSSGDVAWIASIGAVREHGSDRPLRFSAILVRSSDRWRFRQVHFQWDERDPSSSDLVKPSTQVKLVKWLLQRVRQSAQSVGKLFGYTGTRAPSAQP